MFFYMIWKIFKCLKLLLIDKCKFLHIFFITFIIYYYFLYVLEQTVMEVSSIYLLFAELPGYTSMKLVRK